MKSVWRGRGGGRVERREGSSECEIYADVFESVLFSRVFLNLLPFPPFSLPSPQEPFAGGEVWDGYLGKEAGMH